MSIAVRTPSDLRRAPSQMFPPDSRYGTRTLFGCRGVPAANIGRDGDLATDPTTAKLYLKSNGVWAFKSQAVSPVFLSPESKDISTVDGDPLLFGLFPYFLALTPVGTSMQLDWYLTGASSFPISGAETSAAQLTFYIQRSTSKTNNPLAPNFSNLNVGHGTLSPESGWKTIAQFNPGDTLPGSNQTITVNNQSFTAWVARYTDTDPFADGTTHVANYRLVYFFFASGQWIEIDWDISTAIKPYHLFSPLDVTQPPYVDAQGLHLAWDAAIPFLTVSHVPCAPNPDGCYRIDYAWPYATLPTDYSVFKSYDGVSFSEVVTSVDPHSSPWYDSDDAHSIYYQWVANFPNGGRFMSNIVHGTY